MKKVEIYIQRYGNGVALGMKGKTEEIERQSNLFYNYKVTNVDPIWMCDTFAYILTTEEILFAGMVAKALCSLMGTRSAKRTIRRDGDAPPRRVSMIRMLAEIKAKTQIERFIAQTFLNETEYRTA